MLWREEKERTFKPHYMHAVKPQADKTYVDLRTTAVNKSNERIPESRRCWWKKIRPRMGRVTCRGEGPRGRHQNDAFHYSGASGDLGTLSFR